MPERNLAFTRGSRACRSAGGPQGRFRRQREAGVVRYITNKPKLDVTEGNIPAATDRPAWRSKLGMERSRPVLNLPLIENTLAVRGVIYMTRAVGISTTYPALSPATQ